LHVAHPLRNPPERSLYDLFAAAALAKVDPLISYRHQTPMKLVTAIIKPSRLDPVLDALKDVGISGLTVSEVRGFGRQKGKTEVYRGAEYEVKLLPKVKIEVATPVHLVESVVEKIATAAKTGKIGDGKVWVYDLDSILRIRTGETNQEAIEG
jgi:nitrogen regulatory protein P-II 2